jgi:hypothetical protein
MEWLKNNSAAVQALASIATLIVTATLAILTARYVRLTKSIAGSAMEQVDHLKDASRTFTINAAKGLAALSARLRVPLEGLRPRGLSHRALREYSLLSDEDVRDLESLARQVSPDASRYAAKAAVSLKKLVALMARARAVSEGHGWAASTQELQDWNEAIDSGPKMLEALEAECRRVAT